VSGFTVRELAAADWPAVLTLEQELFPEDAWTEEMFEAEFAQVPDHRLYLAAHSGQALIGYAGMLFTGGPEADVVTIAVAKPQWGKGVGTALLAGLLNAAVGRSCAEVYLEVRADNPRAQALYERHGFMRVGVRKGYYQPAGVDAIVMRKELPR
jgi:[ribosomal protein S18]-alanine N-acetyltransferase